jgi:hypothetical protein
LGFFLRNLDVGADDSSVREGLVRGTKLAHGSSVSRGCRRGPIDTRQERA